MNKKWRPTIKDLTAIALLAFGIILAFVALLTPPPGQIHDSVLFLFAQILIYCGSIFGMGGYISQRMKELTKHDPDRE